MHEPAFPRTVEDFDCLHCGHSVSGSGYTNHCPRCLWSRHVDRNPGDRASTCGGMMAPLSVVSQRGGYRILHRCQDCGHQKWNKSAPDDDFEQLLALAREGRPG